MDRQRMHAALAAAMGSLLIVAIVSADATFAIYSMRLDGSDVRLVQADRLLNFGSAAVTPDGTTVAFDAWPGPTFQNTNQWIMLCHVDGTSLKKIVKGAMPQWSPDAKLIAFQDYVNGVAIVNADGSGKEVIAEDMGNPCWLNCGHRLSILEWGRNFHIQNLVTGERQPVLKRLGHWIHHGHTVSPDGTQLCYARGMAPDTELVLASISGKTLPKVLYQGEVCTGAHWHPDGKRIVFAIGAADRAQKAYPSVPAQLHLLDVTAGIVSKVPGQDPQQRYVNPCFSPNGNRIFYSSTSR